MKAHKVKPVVREPGHFHVFLEAFEELRFGHILGVFCGLAGLYEGRNDPKTVFLGFGRRFVTGRPASRIQYRFKGVVVG